MKIAEYEGKSEEKKKRKTVKKGRWIIGSVDDSTDDGAGRRETKKDSVDEISK